MPLQIQQNYNKVDGFIKEAIIESIRQSMPIDEILRSYLEDSVIENVSKNQVKSDNTEMETTPNDTTSVDNIINEENIIVNIINERENSLIKYFIKRFGVYLFII